MNNEIDVSAKPPGSAAGSPSHGVRVNGLHYHLPDGTPTGEQVLKAAGLRPVSEYVLLRWPQRGPTDEVGLDELLDLEGSGAGVEFLAMKADGIRYFVLDEERFAWAGDLDIATLRRTARLDPSVEVWVELQNEPDRQLGNSDLIDLAQSGVERLRTRKPTWKLDVQGETTEWDNPAVQVRDALIKAGFDVNKPWDVKFKVAGQPIRDVSLNDTLDLSEPGVERLRVAPRNVTNGDGPSTLRRDFSLLQSDVDFLDGAGFQWQTINDGQRWLIVENYSLPGGYNVPVCRLAVDMPEGYPSAQLDMFYCEPPLTANGAAPAQTEHREPICGTSFQRWSRHRAADNEWDPARDNLGTHFALIELSLGREVGA